MDRVQPLSTPVSQRSGCITYWTYKAITNLSRLYYTA